MTTLGDNTINTPKVPELPEPDLQIQFDRDLSRQLVDYMQEVSNAFQQLSFGQEINGDLLVNGTVYIMGALELVGDFDMTGNLGLTGDISAVNGTFSGNLAVGAIGDVEDAIGGKQPLSAQLTTLAGLSPADGNFIVGSGTAFTVEAGSVARDSIGLGVLNTPEFLALEIGDEDDTTLARVSPGVLAVEGDPLLMESAIGEDLQPYDELLSPYARIIVLTSDLTLTLANAGYVVYHPPTDTTPRTVTIPANASVAFPLGTVISIDNDDAAGEITIAITSDTLVWVGDGSTGSRTLESGGQATLLKVASTRWRISGQGLS